MISQICTFNLPGIHGPLKLNKDKINEIGSIALALFSVLCTQRRPHSTKKQTKKDKVDNPHNKIGQSHLPLIHQFVYGDIRDLFNTAVK